MTHNLFVAFLLLSLAGLLIALIKPSVGLFWLKVPTRNKGFWIYGFTAILFIEVLIHGSFPYYVDRDSIEQAFGAYTFSNHGEPFRSQGYSSGFENSDSLGNRIYIEYDRRNNIVYETRLIITPSDTILTSSEVDKLIAFVSYFDKSAADHYRSLKPELLSNDVYADDKDDGLEIDEKEICFKISHSISHYKYKIWKGEKVDRKDLYLTISVTNLTQQFKRSCSVRQTLPIVLFKIVIQPLMNSLRAFKSKLWFY